MKKYILRIPPEIQIFVSQLHPLLKGKIRKALEEIEANPFLGKPLKDRLKGFYSYRVSQYRVIYAIRHQEVLVEVVDIAERKIVYSKLELRLSPKSGLR